MKLYEYEAKRIFKDNGIPVLESELVSSPEEGLDFFRKNGPIVLKSQVLSGGRGKAGGIKFAETEEEYREKTAGLLKLSIKGIPVKKILLERKLDIRNELYLGYAILRSKARILLMFSAEGGVDIEELSRNRPESVIKREIDINRGITPGEISSLLKQAGLEKDIINAVAGTAHKLYGIFTDYECEVAEINPLVVTGSGEILAADARIAIYDEAVHKHPGYIKEEDTYTELEKQARRINLGYVEMDGNIGVIGNGAGLNMATLDIITHFGGKPANFLEVSGRTYGKAKEAIQIVLSNPNVKVIFGNFFGCISRCDVIAQGLAKAYAEGIIRVPIVISMRGTGAEEGIKTLRAAGMNEIYEDDIEAGEKAVSLLKEV
ncbi:MAG: ADP-forming succinate--CoA ligase subunit beta [Elusimicrobia bacterium]|nr:ADP-forming succinate--CoA ligase subunit beta [Elusimicrobiota bacterium]